jgi:hypothetical protein
MDKLRYKLIKWLAGKTPVVMNVFVDGNGIKDGWCFFTNSRKSFMNIFIDGEHVKKIMFDGNCRNNIVRPYYREK